MNMFLNKRFNLCYGILPKQNILKHLAIGLTLAVKQPPFVKQVNYAMLIDELWKTMVSDNKEDDNLVKKTVANTNFGMLEKGISQSQRSFLCTTYDECKYYQAQYGGEVSVVRQYKEKQSYYNSPLDSGVKDADLLLRVEFCRIGNVLFVSAVI